MFRAPFLLRAPATPKPFTAAPKNRARPPPSPRPEPVVSLSEDGDDSDDSDDAFVIQSFDHGLARSHMRTPLRSP